MDDSFYDRITVGRYAPSEIPRVPLSDELRLLQELDSQAEREATLNAQLNRQQELLQHVAHLEAVNERLRREKAELVQQIDELNARNMRVLDRLERDFDALNKAYQARP